jgi:hypothetical protein
MTSSFSKPDGPRCFARKISPIPPEASFRSRTYFPKCGAARLRHRQTLIVPTQPRGVEFPAALSPGCPLVTNGQTTEIRLSSDAGGPRVSSTGQAESVVKRVWVDLLGRSS